MRVKFITFEKFENRVKDSVGSSRIRARWIWENWDEASEYQMGDECDVLIFQKAYWRRMLEEFKGIKIWDMCDPDWLDPRPVFECISHCDAVTTSTEALAEYVRKLTDKPVIYIPDRMDMKYYPEYKKDHNKELKEVVWFGFHQNVKTLERTLKILQDRGLRLTVISNASYQPHPMHGEPVINNIKYDQSKINEELMSRDIVLLPEPEGYRGKFKSNNKTLTAWALGLPVAREPGDLKKLMDVDLRRKLGLEGRKEVEDNWNIHKSVEQWKELIQQCKIKSKK